MSVSPDSAAPLMQIRCPGCAQKFKVETHLRGKMVECGNCERQFRVEEKVITKIDRVFPGEKRDPQLKHFAKPATAQAATPLQPVGPLHGVSFLRLLFGLSGALAILATYALFFIDLSWGFAQLDVAGRFTAVGATALLATGCFLLANPDNRKRGLLLGFVGLVVMLVLPFAVPLPPAAAVAARETPGAGGPVPDAVAGQTHDEALEEMGYVVVKRARAEQLASGGEDAAGQVVAVWLRGVKEVSKVELKDYLIRVSGANDYSHLYPRSKGDFLMVLQGAQISFSGLQQQCLRLGTLGRIFLPERTIELIVADLPYSEEPGTELANIHDPGFYAMNLRELESIDLNRAGRAAERLAGVAPQKFRSDIVRRLIQLLSEGDAEFKGRIAAALSVWSEPGDLAADAALRAVQSLMLKEEKVPEALVSFLLLKQEPAILPVLDGLWRADPLTWERVYADGGPFAEATLLASFEQTDGLVRQSAVLILARLGSAKSLPVLSAALAQASGDQDLQLAMKKAIAAIEERTP
jgi:hypothetical protein